MLPASKQEAASFAHSNSSKKRGLKLGRRPGTTDTRDIILDAAEEAFAAEGYVGTSLRTIAERAQVNSALVQYYFGSKEKLFKAVFLRRGRKLSDERIELLSELERRPNKPPTVEEIVCAFLIPVFKLKRHGPGGIAFMRLQARLQSESAWLTMDLRADVYEKALQRYIAALRRALPELDRNAVVWRMAFMVGAYFYIMTDTGRVEVMSGGKNSSKNLDESFNQLVSFFVGGFKAPLLD